MRCRKDESAGKSAKAPRAVCTQPLPFEVGRSKRIGQGLSGLDQDGLTPLNVAFCETIERRGDEQGPHQVADLVENRYGETSGTLHVLGQRQIDACPSGQVDAFHQLISVGNCSGCDPAKIGRPKIPLSPVGGLKCHEHNAEGAVQRNFSGERLNDPGSLRAIAPINHDGLASLQDGKAAVFASHLRQPLDMWMDDPQQPLKRIKRRSQRKKPRSKLVFAIFEPLKNSIFDKRAGNAGNCRNGQSDTLANVGH